MSPLKRPEVLPLSDAARLDREIGERIHRISSGRVVPGDVSEASRLIRERADLMMPEVLRRESDSEKVGAVAATTAD
jgi:hypothetical protein